MKIKVDDHLASQAFLALQRVVGADVEDRRRSVDDGQPNHLGQVIRVGTPSPQAHGRGVFLLNGGDVEVVGDAVLADDLSDDLVVPGLERDPFKAQVDVEVESGHLGMGELRPPGDVEVEAAGGEAPRRGNLLAVVLEREGGEEVVRVRRHDAEVVMVPRINYNVLQRISSCLFLNLLCLPSLMINLFLPRSSLLGKAVTSQVQA